MSHYFDRLLLVLTNNNRFSKKGIKTVLIPKTSLLAEEPGSISLQEYADNLSVEIKEVGNLHETLYEFTGKIYKIQKNKLEIDPIYQQTMKNISIKLLMNMILMN